MHINGRIGKSVAALLLPLLIAVPAGAAQVGLASVDIEPPVGIPLAGYGARARRLPGYVDWGDKLEHAAFFRPSTGRHTPIESKAMVVRAGGEQVVFVSLALVGVEKRMVADLAGRLAHLGVREEQLVVGATHTHSGPGTISHRFSMALIAVDRFRRENYEWVLGRIVESVEQAFDALQDARLWTTAFETEGLQRNKWRRQGERHYDRRARFLLATSADDGRMLGGLLNYALHGNGMPIDDLRFSSDVLGSIADRMESLLAERNGGTGDDPVLLFINGAEGDVGNPERSVEAVRRDGVSFAAQAAASGFLDRLQPVADDIELRRARVWLGLPGVSLRNCTGGGKRDGHGVDLRLPMPLMQQRSFVSYIRLGHVHMLTWPGEPSTRVGYDTRALAARLGAEDSWILGLVNDYQSYFTTRSEYHEGEYDSCNSLFRWKGAERIQRAIAEMLNGNQDDD